MIETIVLAVIGSGVLSALIAGIFGLIKDKQAHKYQTSDEEKQDMKALKKAVRLLLCDRIRYISIARMAEEKIDPDELRMLNEMHDSYHNGLGGNGDLDQMMKRINELPLKSNE